ncbi:hypothetical protein D3Z36_03030 [Lachnospiraceae bacterium]|nr:hypothetical protein [Lachnospiraceae bacterium]
MNEFMKILLSLSVSGALLLLIIWGLKPLYKSRFSRRWQYYIWIIVTLRFLLPFTPDTTIVGSLFESFDTTVITTESPTSQNAPVAVNMNNNKAEPIQANGNIAGTPATHKTFSLYAYMFVVWVALTLVLFVRKITVYQGFIQYIKAGNTEVSDIKTLNLLSDCVEKLNIKTNVELSYNPLIASPMLIGFFRPRIVLPVNELEDKELSYIFVHELIHYKQWDMFYKWLIQIVVCVHWFNPFVYLLEREVNKSCELSCDEKVISVLDDKARREYGDTLISFLKSNKLYKNSLASITLTEGAEQLKERLGAIMGFKSKTKTIQIMTGLLTLCILFGAVFIGSYPVAATDSSPEESGNSTMPEKKNSSADTYIYDENLEVGWYMNGEDLKNDMELESDNSYQYTYTQNGYYCNSYIIEMGWNLSAKARQYYGEREIVLKDKTKMTIYFSDTAKDYMNDSGAVTAIEELIDSLKNTNVSPVIEMPLILNVTPVAVDDIPNLIENYFQNEDLIRFSALFSAVDNTTQKDYCQKIYDADKIALFSTIVQRLDEDTILLYVDKSEQDNKTNFFAVLSDYMQPSDLKSYAEKYYNDGNIARFSILLDGMIKEQKQEWLIKAQTDKKTNFVSVLSDNLYD